MTTSDWQQVRNIHWLNVAGNRERTNPGIGEAVRSFLVFNLSKEG